MSKKQTMGKCIKCNSEYSKGMKYCPVCGMKNKKPFYKQWWIILIIIIGVGFVISLFGSNNPEDNNAGKDGVKTQIDNDVVAEKEEGQKEIEKESDKTTELINGMRPEFKSAMDSYETFYDEYCEFMKTYNQNQTDLKMIAKYTEIMKKAVDMDEKFKAWDGSDLNNEELKYYIEVQSRVSQKLVDLAGN
ncbi:MAG: DUF6591 domain-containing protein [Lachnospira sp.]